MAVFCGLLILGIVLTVFGISIWKNPDLLWDLSLTRKWYIKGGEPSGAYYFNQRVRSTASIFFGVVLIIVSISMVVIKARGYVVEIDGNEIKIPCAYSDIEALGYQLDLPDGKKTLYDTEAIARNAEGKEILLTLINRSDEAKLVTECEVTTIRVYVENAPNIALANGVKTGMSESEVKSIMVQSSYVNESEIAYYDTKGFEKYLIRVAFAGVSGNKEMTWIEVRTKY